MGWMIEKTHHRAGGAAQAMEMLEAIKEDAMKLYDKLEELCEEMTSDESMGERGGMGYRGTEYRSGEVGYRGGMGYRRGR